MMNLLECTCLVFLLLCRLNDIKVTEASSALGEGNSWKMGSWSECSNGMKCGYGERRRNVSCVDSDGQLITNTNCNPENKPHERELCFKVCPRHRNSVRWKVGKWGDCLLSNNLRHCKESVGTKVREVTCVHKTRHSWKYNRTVPDQVCLSFYPKPINIKKCMTRCPQNCVVSPFGEWTGCNVCGSINRTRTRTVLVAPEEGGKPCPPLTESERCMHRRECLKHVGSTNEYVLKLGKWSSCISGSNRTSASLGFPIVGYRTRNVSCIDEFGKIVPLSWCTNHFPLQVSPIESCIVSSDCQVSEWSEWILIKEGCITSDGHIYPEHRQRHRKVKKFSKGTGAPCPPLLERRVIRNQLGSCDSKYKWVHSVWSNCISYMGVCGGGLQKRTVFCLRIKDFIPIDDVYCKEIRPPSIQQCNVECTKQCIVSEWSSWSSCLPMNIKDPLKSIRGYRKRTRKTLQKPTGTLDDCPSLIEVNSCQEPEVVRWLTGNWSVCKLHDITQPCGEGVMKRDSICINPKGTHVSSSLCQMHLLPPKLLAPCYIPCPRDCVLAEWTEWSACTVSCTSKEKKEFRTRQRRIIAEHGSGGKPCPAKDTLIESEPCNYESCIGYLWIKSDWSFCQIPKNRTCGKSFQIRNVQCINTAYEVVSDKKCLPEAKPMSHRGCDYPCPVDCSVTNFTEWTPCSDNCVSVQHRNRFVLQPSMHGGYPCPVLEETRNCNITYDSSCMNKLYKNSSTSLYFWNISSWSDCILAEGLHCGKGYQVRKVTCVKNNGKEVLVWNCMSSGEDIVPDSSRSCYVYCNASCSVTEWTSWFAEGLNSCPSLLKRTRDKLGKLCDWLNLQETKPFPLTEIIATPGGHWSQCIVDDNNLRVTEKNVSIIAECGRGKRYIRGSQIESCEQKGLVSDLCLIECPQSCQLSEWTEWSSCNVTCGQGYKQRKRNIISFGNKMGRPCSVRYGNAEIEEDVCEIFCNYYQWSAGEWGECKIALSTKKCGSGSKNRTVSCTKNRGYETFIQVDEIFCDPSTRPPEMVKCYLPCPDDCIVSSWSQWSECRQPCNSEYSRYRNRTVLRMALPSSGKRCPSLVQEEPCNIGYNCFHYKWFIGGWGSCILPDGTYCGKGISSRTATCVRTKGQSVSPEHCQEVLLPSLSKPCNVECPIDCQLSEWTEWNNEQCKSCNNKGERSRMRRIIQEASETGQPCTYDLIQKIPCPYQPCYHWQIGKWSDCLFQGAECGHGYRKRDVECLRTDGVKVDKKKCLRINITENIGGWLDSRWLELVKDVQETETCEKSCPGDCSLTSWSSWNYCHRNCEENQVVGYQTRSRAITFKEEKCPESLWETKPCLSSTCLTYKWKVIGNVMECVGSDGKVVYGGCENLLRPCYPECSVQHAHCDHVLGECVCVAGTLPVHNTSTVARNDLLQLVRCVNLSIMDIDYLTNHTSKEEEIILKFSPDDNEFSFWMYAMICVGCAFVVFVIVTIYLMCTQKSSIRNQQEARGLQMKTYPP